MRNCIYSSGQAIPVLEGPCPEFSADGSEFVDVSDSGTDVLVETEAPISYGMLAAMLLAVVIGASLLGGSSDV
jgi:hypothetical protein